MSSNSSDSSVGVLGNTKTKTQSIPSKRWVFTLNNYSADEFKKIIDVLSSNSSKYSIGEEIGESSTPHLQGYIELSVKKRFAYLKELIPRGHIEKAKGNREDNINYTQKDKKFKQNFKEEVYFEYPTEKLQFLIDLMKQYKFPKGDRKINVVVDYNGCLGKTEFARWACLHFNDCIVTGGKAADMKNQIVELKKKYGRCPKYIILDIPRKNLGFVSYQGIEEVKNMLFYSGKFEGGMIIGNKPFVLMLMNEYPQIDSMSKDRWNIFEINGAFSEEINYNTESDNEDD